jgi:endonuclease YncB( thermonuclease family)
MIYSRILSLPVTFLMIISVLVSTGCMKDSYMDDNEEMPEPMLELEEYGVSFGVLTNNHFVAPGYDTDFIAVIENTGFRSDTYNITVESKDNELVSVIIEEGYEQIEIDGEGVIPFIVNVNLTPYYNSTDGVFSAVLKVISQNSNNTSEVTLNINTNGIFGNKSQIGDSVSVHYAGMLAINGQFFDSSMEGVWDNYSHRRIGVTDDYKHIDPLSASNIGCSYISTNDAVIFSYVDSELSSGQAGLKTGMEVISINDQEVKDRDDYFDIVNLTVANQTINVTVVNSTTNNLDIYHVNLSDMGAFYGEFYPQYYDSWMDGKGFMGINVEDKQELSSERCNDGRRMIVGFDNKMVGMYEGQTLSVRIPAKDAYGEYGSSDLAGHNLIFEIEMLAITHTYVAEEPEEIQNYNMTVTEVIDGDTFYLGNGDKIRMLGINTPESGKPYSQEATEFLTSMLMGKEVTLVNDSKNDDSDSYGRLLSHVYINDTLVNYEIIKVGLAFWYPYTSGTDMDEMYEEAQHYASNNTLGLWTESSYNLTIDYIEYDPEGEEADGEYLVLTNHENYNISMVGWYLQDEAAQTAYEFNFTIMNNTSIRIYTGLGTDNETTLFWGWHQGIWNNSGDFAIIQDQNGYMVDNYRYN